MSATAPHEELAAAREELTGSSATPVVTISHVRKQYAQGARVIDDLSLTIHGGEFVTLLGPSGCGKSTLLKMIAGLASVSAGAINVGNQTPVAARPHVSFVFQDATLLPWRRVRRNVGLLLELQGKSRVEVRKRSDAALDLVGLREVAEYFPRQLSGGMKMRVSIARALATTPRLLLMDEPFGALDEMTRNRLNEELLALKEKEDWTVIFVTHSIPEAVFLSDRVMLMAARPGRIAQEIAIPLPGHRGEGLRSDPEYLRLVGKVSQAMAALH